MLELAHPWALLLLPAPVLVRWLTPSRRERTGALRAPFFDDLVNATGVEARSGVPLLQDLPLIGRLFQVHRTQEITQDLIILVTPTIVRSTG